MATDRHLGIGYEANWGVANPPDAFFEVLREDIQRVPEFIRVTSVRSKSVLKVVESHYNVKGTVEVLLNYQDFPILTYPFLGSADAVGGAGPYTHTHPASTGITARVPCTLEIKRDATATTWRYVGCIITGVAISIRQGQEARATITFIGKDETTGTAATATYPTIDLVLPHQVAVKVDAVTVDATEFNLNMTWPADEPNVLGQKDLARQPEDADALSVEGDFTVLFEALADIYTPFVNETDVDVQLLCDTGGDETLTINMDKCRLIQATPHIEGRARQMQPVSFEAFNTGVAATDPVQIITVNDDAALPVAA